MIIISGNDTKYFATLSEMCSEQKETHKRVNAARND